MKYGNCLTGAVVLMFRLRSMKFRIHFRRLFDLPHFYVVDRAGKKWHYEVVVDVFPFPLGLFLYYGKFEIIK